MIVSLPWQSFWKKPWSYIILELDGQTRACSKVLQTLDEVWQSTTRCRTSIDKKERRELKMRWSCSFQERKVGLITGAELSEPTRGRNWEAAYGNKPSTKGKTLWSMR